jgi:hypothetical protein
MKLNKKGIGPIGAVIIFLVFIAVWFIFLANMVNTAGDMAVESSGLTGIEAFLLNNLNFVVMIVCILGMMAWGYFGANS